MLKEHKKRLLKIIESLQISLSYFETKDEKSIFTTQLKKSPIVFQFKQKPNSFDEFAINYTLYEPGYPTKVAGEQFENLENIYNINGGIDGEFKYWLNAVVKRYIQEKEMPDVDFKFTIVSRMVKGVIVPAIMSVVVSLIGVFLLGGSFFQNQGVPKFISYATQMAATQTAESLQHENTEIPPLNTNSITPEAPGDSATPEPPEIAAARITTNGTVVSGLMVLIGSILSAFAVIRAAKITSELKKKK